jgi:hypothetical protein
LHQHRAATTTARVTRVVMGLSFQAAQDQEEILGAVLDLHQGARSHEQTVKSPLAVLIAKAVLEALPGRLNAALLQEACLDLLDLACNLGIGHALGLLKLLPGSQFSDCLQRPALHRI